MEYVKDIRELIGNTPILKISNFEIPEGINIFAKLEFLNPGGSVKDRACLYMIKDAEEKGLLKKGGTLIEATAGNTGIGLALAALNRGYKVIFVVPDKFSVEKQLLMKALGAEIVNTPKEEGMKGAIKKAEELAREIEGSFIPNQFINMANVRAHYETTGPEIYSQLDGNIDVFVAGAGTGGTFTGVVKYLKEKNNRVKAVLADPIGSIIGGGSEVGCYNIEGIGNSFIPDTMDTSLIDEVEKISDVEAFNAVKELHRREGLIVGSSSGAAFTAAMRQAMKAKAPCNIVVIFPDRGDRYFSKNLYE
ncbi:cysteine synthase A [Thermoanaerobacter thermohydrosulfuricus]|uniref:Cysteine synthase n=2 Tax=Thermoanaerobacter thermohydrosulfuricus TaxID=1516 RepID=M8CWV6_THETY|nr:MULTISPECIES: cysteine synthase family protein [Thermoanaerobacter]EMT38833.1 cysteine synthase [Thermoanaerobacter thermohydrosulfuricus WC1]SDG01008.1 cysteine synthase A [Thermoanaerobacter thermohydrosulfuricus]SFE45504.1 cysteine synthase A [Thermoanaerobacter thermohydrosulfuricus]